MASERTALESARKALEAEQRALEVERKAWSEVDREVLTLRGRVMGTEDASTRLREQVARQAEDLSTLENFCVGTYLFYFPSCWFFLQPISELVAHLLELGGKVKSLEQDLEMVKATFSRNVEELAKSHEERCALEGDLD